jgi:hypothetical protein
MVAVEQRSTTLDEDTELSKGFSTVVDAFVRATLTILKQQSRRVRDDEATPDSDRSGMEVAV